MAGVFDHDNEGQQGWRRTIDRLTPVAIFRGIESGMTGQPITRSSQPTIPEYDKEPQALPFRIEAKKMRVLATI
jgi:hypothetical protein